MRPSDSLTWTELNQAAARQYVEACAVHRAWIEARAHYAGLAGTFSWVTEKTAAAPIEVLVRRDEFGQTATVGRRSRETEGIAESFALLERLARERVEFLKTALEHHQRLNKALEVGQASVQLVQVLDTLQNELGGEPVTVLGPHAILGYAAAAGVLPSYRESTHSLCDIWNSYDLTIALASSPTNDDIETALRLVDDTYIFDANKWTAENNSQMRIYFLPSPLSAPTFPYEKNERSSWEETMSAHLPRWEGCQYIHIASLEGQLAQIAVPGLRNSSST